MKTNTRLWIGRLADPMVDAMFVCEFVAEHGIEKVMDEYFYDPWEMMRRFSYWCDYTSNGVWWIQWNVQALRHRRSESGRSP